MATPLLLFLALLTVTTSAFTDCPNTLAMEQAVLAPWPSDEREAPGILPDEPAAEENEEDWPIWQAESPAILSAVPHADRSSFAFGANLAPHPLHARDRRGSPRGPPAA